MLLARADEVIEQSVYPTSVAALAQVSSWPFASFRGDGVFRSFSARSGHEPIYEDML
jgi:hypothetical protein